MAKIVDDLKHLQPGQLVDLCHSAADDDAKQYSLKLGVKKDGKKVCSFNSYPFNGSWGLDEHFNVLTVTFHCLGDEGKAKPTMLHVFKEHLEGWDGRQKVELKRWASDFFVMV